MQSTTRNSVHWLTAAVLIAASAGTVSADGWKIQLMGGANLGSCYAGRSVLGDDASAVWGPYRHALGPRGIRQARQDVALQVEHPEVDVLL